MADLYPRSITFSIPGELGLPGLRVTVVENAGNLDFTVEGITAESRGLFFQLVDESVLRTLKILGGGGLITKTQIKADGVFAFDPNNFFTFDVGVAFKATAGPVHFTLDATRDLTLDDIAKVQFGTATVGNQLTSGRFVAPAAPDAKNDTVTTPEDKAITIRVLANDTDADFQQLTITSVHLESGTHGTVSIAANGGSIIYTPDKDYAGTNFDSNSIDATFKYTVSDGFGGQDTASVSIHIVPVADQPTITVEVLPAEASDPINMVRLKVTATQTDLDGSEFIDRIEFATLPAGFQLVTDGNLSTVGQPDSVTEFVQLLLPTGQDVNFDLRVTAYAKEEGNGAPDEASASAVQHIGIDFNHNETQSTFLANDQSIWGTGDAFSIDKSLFLGPNVSLNADLVLATTEGHFKAGLTADVHLQGGAIDAHIPFDITVDTTYNTTTDSILIHTGAVLASGGGFSTTGPEGNFNLGALLDFAIAIKDPVLGETIYSYNTPGNVLSGTLAAFSSTSPDLPSTLSVPFGSISLDWPHLSTTSTTPTGNMISSDGTSNNFITLTADLDYMAAYFFPIFQPVEEFIGPDITDDDPESTFQWLDLKASIGANLVQEFVLKALGLGGTLIFEDGTTQNFVFGQDILIPNASHLEGDDANGTIDFSLLLNPNVTLDNTTSIGFNANGNLYIAKNSDIFDAITVPLFSTPIGSITIDDGGAFSLVFNSQSWDFAV